MDGGETKAGATARREKQKNTLKMLRPPRRRHGLRELH